MSKIDDAFDQVIGLAEKFKAILDVSEAVKEIGSLEQTIAERKAARDAAIEEHTEVQAQLDIVKAQLQEAQNDFAAERDAHKKALEDASAAATANLQQRVDDANNLANSIINNANLTAMGIKTDCDKAISSRQETLAALDDNIEAANAQLEAVKAEYAATVAAIETLKSAAKAVLA